MKKISSLRRRLVDRTLPLKVAAGGSLVALALVTGACGGAQLEATQAKVLELDERLKELERDSGRAGVRFQDVDDRLSLVEDRVATNRLAMERRGIARPLPVVVATPIANGETGLSSPPRYAAPTSAALPMRADRGRISLPNSGVPSLYGDEVNPSTNSNRTIEGAYEDVTITEEDFNRFVTANGSSRPSSANSGPRRAKEPVVVGDSLPVVGTDKSGAATEVADPGGSPMEVYKRALSRYRTGEYASAANDFEGYLKSNPPRDYLDNAYYWLGECSFGLGQYDRSISYFNRVIKEIPEGNKVPDSMLKASMAYLRTGKKSSAKDTLYNLMETYPSTNAAKLAGEKLKDLD
jgi:tol-pal system protein YbgF